MRLSAPHHVPLSPQDSRSSSSQSDTLFPLNLDSVGLSTPPSLACGILQLCFHPQYLGEPGRPLLGALGFFTLQIL